MVNQYAGDLFGRKTAVVGAGGQTRRLKSQRYGARQMTNAETTLNQIPTARLDKKDLLSHINDDDWFRQPTEDITDILRDNDSQLWNEAINEMLPPNDGQNRRRHLRQWISRWSRHLYDTRDTRRGLFFPMFR